MPTNHLILCGGAKCATRKHDWTRKADRLELDTRPKNGNINLRIADISDAMFANLPDEAVDLLEIATYVYCADQATLRGGKKEIEYGHKWRRHFRFEIPVRKPDVWRRSDVQAALTNTLGFLSDDDYEFHFSGFSAPPSRSQYLEFSSGTPTTSGIDEVILFSGGLDSFAGAVEEVLTKGKRVALVSHRSVSKIDKRQRQLVEDIRNAVNEPSRQPFHVPVWINKEKKLGKEYTQRSRSFLYACIGAVVARVFNLDHIKFFENGVVSLNLPLAAQAVGGRSTRTTHPKVLNGFAEIFSLAFGVAFTVENPFAWKTKAEILTDVKTAGYSKLCAYTSSCAHPWEQTTLYSHCGRCSQCVDRRLVALAAGYNDDEDPSEMYKTDVLLGERTDPEEINLVESYARVMGEVDRMEDAVEFHSRFGEASRAIRHIPGKSDEVAQKIFDLYKRHAHETCKALEGAARRHLSELVRGELPATSMLRIALGGRLEAKQTGQDVDKYEWAHQAELVRATDQVLGQDSLNKGVLSKACGVEITTNGGKGRASLVNVKSFLVWVRKKHDLGKIELDQVRNAVIGEIMERKD